MYIFREKKMKTLYKNEQSGRSMVEMLGVLAIIGVLSVGGIAGYSKAMAKYKLSKAMDQVSMTVANIRTLYSGQPSYSGLDTKIAIQMGAIGTEMLNGVQASVASKAYNSFNGGAFVNASKDGRSFFVTFTGLGKEACVALSTADWGSGSGSGLIGIGVSKDLSGEQEALPNGENNTGTTAKGTLPLSIAKAAGGCSGDGDENAVVWNYN